MANDSTLEHSKTLGKPQLHNFSTLASTLIAPVVYATTETLILTWPTDFPRLSILSDSAPPYRILET